MKFKIIPGQNPKELEGEIPDDQLATLFKSFSDSQVNLAEKTGSSEDARLLLSEIKEDIKTLRPEVMEEYLKFAGKDRFLSIGKELGFIQEETIHVAETVSQEKNTQAAGKKEDAEAGTALRIVR